MKFTTILLWLLFTLGIAHRVLPQQFSWVYQNTAGTGSSYGTSIATDAAGNSFVAGAFDKTLRVGDSTFVADNHYTYTDEYFAKYDPAGQLLWVRRVNSPEREHLQVVGVDGEGSCYIAGSFSSPINFGDTTLTPATSSDHVYLAKYSAAGKRMWLKQISIGRYSTLLWGSKADAYGNVYLVLQGSSWDGSNYWMLHKYNKSGKELSSLNVPYAARLALGPAGEVYLSGFITSQETFGNKTFEGDFSSYVCKYNPDGSLAWATHLKGTDPVQSFGISIDSDGNSYITGTFWGTFVVGKDTVREVGSASGIRDQP